MSGLSRHVRSLEAATPASGRVGCEAARRTARLGAALVCALVLACLVASDARAVNPSLAARRRAYILREGPLVDRIEFVGNDTFDRGELLKYMNTAESGFLSVFHFSRRTIDDDLENLERFYATRGFLEADAALEDVALSADSLHIDLLISVYEGPRWEVREITYSGNSAMTEEELSEITTLSPGDPLLSNELAPDRRKILEAYARRSYLDARVLQTVERDAEGRSASVHYSIRERERAVIDSISVVGDDKTREFVIRRELAFSPGDYLDPEVIGETQAEIYRTGLFNSVWIEPSPADTGRAMKTVVVRVGERPSGHYEFEVGYAALDGPEFGAGIVNRNVQGQAIELSAEGKYSTYGRFLEGSVGDPYFTGRPISAKTSLDYEWSDEETYTAERGGARFVLSKRFGSALTVEGGYGFARTTVFGDGDELNGDETNYTSDIAGAVTYDTRNDILNPRRGMLARVSTELASSQLGGTNDFVRYELEWRGYGRVAAGTICALGVRAGWVNPHGDGADVPVNERYFAGGDGSVRGFERNALSPLDDEGDPKGGRALAEIRGEVRFPVLKELRGVVFADAGQAFDDFEALRPSRLEVGAGLGLRLGTPVGVMRVDVAYPLTEDGDLRYYFGVGQAF